MEATLSNSESSGLNKSANPHEQKLSCVFDAMRITKEPIHDDTLLEKMADWVESLVVSPESVTQLLDATSCCAYFHYVQNPRVLCSPDRLVLGLRLAAHLANQNWAAIQHLTVPSVDVESGGEVLLNLWQVAQSADHWQHGGVRDAWLRGLQKILRTPQGLCWIHKNGFIGDILKLLTDRSMFVCKTAQVLTAKLLLCAHRASGPTGDRSGSQQNGPVEDNSQQLNGNLVDETAEKAILDILLNHIFKGPGCSSTVKNGSITAVSALGVEVLEMATQETETHRTFWMHLQKNWDLRNSLQTRLLMDKVNRRKIQPLCMNILAHLVQQRCLTADDVFRLCKAPDELYLMEDMAAVVAMATWLAIIYPEKSDSQLEWLLLPLKAILADPSKCDLDVSHHMDLISREGGRPIRQYLTTLSTKAELLPAPCQRKLFQQLCAFLHQLVSHRSPSWLKGQQQLQQQILQICCSIDITWITAIDLQGLLDSSLQLLKDGQTSASLVQWAYRCLVKCLGASSKNSGQIPDDLHSTVMRSLCHPNWEMRDTGLQTINSLVDLAQAGDFVILDWLVECRLANQVWQSCGDGESYVRAAALSGLGRVAGLPRLWESLLETCKQEEIVSGLIKVILEDSEGFARRAALEVICSWSEKPAFSPQQAQIGAIINSSIHDLDWEVKLLVLKYWEEQLERLTSPQPSVPDNATGLNPDGSAESALEALKGLGESGCYKTIATAFQDHDPSVQHKAYAITDKLCSNLKEQSQYDILSSDVNSDNDTSGEPLAKRKCPDSTSSKCVSGPHSLSEFLYLVEGLDLNRCLKESAQSTDEYQRNPLTLLDDILTSLRQNSEDNAIDCY